MCIRDRYTNVPNVRCGQKTAAAPNTIAKKPRAAILSAIEVMSVLLILNSPFIVITLVILLLQISVNKVIHKPSTLNNSV